MYGIHRITVLMDPELIGPDSPKVKEEEREKEAYHTGTGS
jgi:hypothetical protein